MCHVVTIAGQKIGQNGKKSEIPFPLLASTIHILLPSALLIGFSGPCTHSPACDFHLAAWVSREVKTRTDYVHNTCEIVRFEKVLGNLLSTDDIIKRTLQKEIRFRIFRNKIHATLSRKKPALFNKKIQCICGLSQNLYLYVVTYVVTYSLSAIISCKYFFPCLSFNSFTVPENSKNHPTKFSLDLRFEEVYGVCAFANIIPYIISRPSEVYVHLWIFFTDV